MSTDQSKKEAAQLDELIEFVKTTKHHYLNIIASIIEKRLGEKIIGGVDKEIPPMTWRELKQFCNQLPEKELAKKVMLWQEAEAITNISAMRLEQDHCIDTERPEDGCFGVDEVDADAIEGELEKVYDAGHPILFENF